MWVVPMVMQWLSKVRHSQECIVVLSERNRRDRVMLIRIHDAAEKCISVVTRYPNG